MREKFEYFLVLLLVKITKILPIKFIYFLFDKLAILLYLILKSRNKIAYLNLKNAFVNLDDKEIKKTIYQNYKDLARTLADIVLLYSERKKVDDFLINKDEAVKKIALMSKNGETGTIFVTAHFGNWELLAHFCAQNGFAFSVVGRKGNNALIDEKIVIPFREKFGNRYICKDEAMIKMVKALKKGENIGLLTDQKTDKSGLVTTFFGRECRATKTVASLNLKFNAPIVIGFARRIDDKYQIDLYDFPKVDENLSKDEKELFITQTCNDIFEKAIKTAPTQWMWMHNRWKMD